MSDHNQIYQRFGINRLYSFDGEESIADRSRFNRPTHDCICKNLLTSDVADSIPSIRRELNLSSSDPLIVWFDFVDPMTESTLKDACLLLGSLSEGDIARFTFNAHPGSYLPKSIKGKVVPLKARQKYRREYFANLFESAELDLNDLSERYLDFDQPNISTRIIETLDQAALNTLGSKPELDFEILSTVHYKIGADMVTITGAMVKGANRRSLLDVIDLPNWTFGSTDVYKPFKLTLDQITLREYLSLDRFAASKTDPATVKAALGFDKIGQVSLEQAYEGFKQVARFYPSFLEVAT